MKKVLFVDDDKFFASIYCESLQKYYELTICYEADKAVNVLNDCAGAFEAVVLDMMMPPPEGLFHECCEGLTTGVWVLDQCREVIKDHRIAVLIFTNQGAKGINTELAFLELDSSICQVRSKTQIEASELPHIVGRLIGRR